MRVELHLLILKIDNSSTKKVFEKFKVNLDLELKLIGDSLNE